MADKPIGELTPASELLTTDLLAVEQGGVAKSITGQILAGFARAQAASAAADAEDYRDDAEAAADRAEAASLHPPYIDSTTGHWFVWSSASGTFVDSGVDASITVTIADITEIATTATPYVTNTGTSTDPIFHLFLPAADGIASIAKTSTSGLIDTYTITKDSSETYTFTVTNGNGVASIIKTGASGLVDTYTITFDNGQTATFTVTNGEDGYSPVVTISSVTGGHEVTITDESHPSGQSFTVLDGVDGTDGTDGADGVSPSVTIATIVGGHSVTITDADHPSGQTFNVLDGTGSGDMQASTYDPQSAVANAGGIPDYVESQVPTAAEKAAWNAKADTSDIPEGATATPLMDGTAAAGSSTDYARADHVHPTDTSRQKQMIYRQVTLSSANWNSSNQQTVTVTGVLADETKQLIQPVPNEVSLLAYYSSGVKAVAQAANGLTFQCDETPSGNLTVFVVISDLEAAT